ncbi:hypothetical protein D3878_10450 [Noviherbaspirillum sedimenti]|uniref:Uncharacterized protein n=1 Tax=Noviherbaspirillum sedimenti TaxID=2320865 RepID=A0A3A3GTM3_9BURK|nr:hypothetical protein D3878_10450 [Noviherbaspirillum sedimenti]
MATPPRKAAAQPADAIRKPAAAAKPAAVAKPAPTPPGAVKPVVSRKAVPAKSNAVAPAAALAAPKDKPKKPKLVRDSFTMPEAEYKVLADLKKACIKAGFEVKKSELLRVGVALMQRADVAQLQQVLATLPSLKAGRPKKAK